MEQTSEISPVKALQIGMSEMLRALGFVAMAQEVLTETDIKKLREYRWVVVKCCPRAASPIDGLFALVGREVA